MTTRAVTRTALGIAVAHACLRHARQLGWNRADTLGLATQIADMWAPMFWSAAMLLAWTGLAHCQDRPTDEEVIARTFISEEGFDGAEGWPSLGAVIRWRAETNGSSLREAAEALSPRLHASPCTVTTRLWRCDLEADLSRPRGLGATWERPRGELPSRRDRWAEALTAAAEFIAGGLTDSCEETPHAWGSRADVALRLRAGERWDDAGCPGRNRYGRRLRRVTPP